MVSWVNTKKDKIRKARAKYLRQAPLRIDPKKLYHSKEGHSRKDHTFLYDVPKSLGISKPKEESIKKYLEVIGDNDSHRYLIVYNNIYYRIILLVKKDSYVFLEVHYACKTLRKSHSYSSLEAAKKAYTNDLVHWVEVIKDFE